MSDRSERFRAAAEEGLTARSLAESVGGVRGIVESMVPGMLFLGVYAFTNELMSALIGPVAFGVVSLLVRFVRREPVMPALAGLMALALSAFLALRSGNDADYFLLGFVMNAGWIVAFTVSLLVNWPLVGVGAGLLSGTGSAWRAHRPCLIAMRWLTLAWIAVSALRLAVQLPLYLAGNVTGLGTAKLLMGTPMQAVLLVGTFLVAKGVLEKSGILHPNARDIST